MSTHKTFMRPGAEPDWAAFEHHEPVTTIQTFGKFSAAGIHPLAGHLGELLAEQFKLSPAGTRFASYGYNNLGVHTTSGIPLVFGFGPDHIIRIHADNTGFVFLIIAGALMEYYNPDFVALVFYEMTVDLGIPQKLLATPALWKGPMHAFNGVLVNTRFGILVDECVRLNPYIEPLAKQKDSRGTKFGSNPASPKAVVKILKAIGALSMGGTEPLTIVGDSDGGLFVAMADQLFGLRTVVRSDSGKELRSNCNNQEPQVTIIFSPTATGTSAESGMHQMQLTGLTCRLESDMKKVDNKELDFGQAYPLSSGGRIYWESLSIDVYGNDFMDLIRTSHEHIHFGEMIGSAARVFEGFVADTKDENAKPSSWRFVTPGSYGAGLVETLIAYFPNMSRARPRMERPLRLSFKEARSKYEEEAAKLIAFCDCDVCHIGDGSPRHHRKYCLVVIVESTVTLGLLLAKTIVSPDVYPKRAGLEGFYRYWAGVRKELNRKRAEIAEEDRFAFMYRDALSLLKGGVVLSSCLCLFSATLPDIPDPNALAFSCNGIVAYSGLLHGSIGYRSQWDTSTRVMAGVIQYQGRVYRSVVADAVLMERIEKGEAVVDYNVEYEIVEPHDPEQALVLKLKE